MSTGSTIAEADRAAASGDLAQAERLLTRAAAEMPQDLHLLLKLAAVTRAAGRPREALSILHRALAQSPLDFVALVLRATLLDSLGEPSGEAWEHALAHQPPGDLPPSIAAAVAAGKQRREAWLSARKARMKQEMSIAEANATSEERACIDRFRSNVLRETRPYHSEPTHFHYPGLVEREFHPRRLFPWVEQLESATESIAAEFKTVMAAERAELVPYIQYADHEPLDKWRPLNKNSDWTAIHLWQNGRIVEANARYCTRTMALLAAFGQPVIRGACPNAMFSLLAPRTAIPAHVGYNNTRLVCHLPLIVPEGCWFRVGAETRNWRAGEAFVFDDTIEHEALNPSDELRVVFIFDVWHPDLRLAEREAVAALIGAEGGRQGL